MNRYRDPVFADDKRRVVYIVTHRRPPSETTSSVHDLVCMAASFGGFLNRKNGGFPCAEVSWIRFARCHDFVIAMRGHQ